MDIAKESSLGSIAKIEGGEHPVYVTAMETNDPHVTALAEITFWMEQFEEHALLLETLLAGSRLAEEREVMTLFRGPFVVLKEEAMATALEQAPIAVLSRSAVELTRNFIEAHRVLDSKQRSGELQSLAWPTLFTHVTVEEERFIQRQREFMAGDVRFDREEVINFWAEIMGEHADFVAHLLDPAEQNLINTAIETSKAFWDMKDNHPLEGNADPLPIQVQKVIDFKAAALDGIKSGKIQSIIPAWLADHVRREAVLFLHELKKADKALNVEPKAA